DPIRRHGTKGHYRSRSAGRAGPVSLPDRRTRALSIRARGGDQADPGGVRPATLEAGNLVIWWPRKGENIFSALIPPSISVKVWAATERPELVDLRNPFKHQHHEARVLFERAFAEICSSLELAHVNLDSWVRRARAREGSLRIFGFERNA